MVASFKEINRLVRDPVHQAVFLSDAARPTARQHICQRFGLSWPFEGVPHDCLDEIQHPDCSASLKDRNPLTFPLHRGSFASIPMPFRASFFPVLPAVVLPEDVGRFPVSVADAQFPEAPASSVAGSNATSRAPRRPDNHRLLLVDHRVKNAGEVFTQTRICCLPGQGARGLTLSRTGTRCLPIRFASTWLWLD